MAGQEEWKGLLPILVGWLSCFVMSRKNTSSSSFMCRAGNTESISFSLYVPRLLCTSKQATRRLVTLFPFVFPNCKSCPSPSFPLYASDAESPIWSHVNFSIIMSQDSTATRRVSLRRLGSLANINFNLFNRRRSHPVADTAAIPSDSALLSIPDMPSETDSSQSSLTLLASTARGGTALSVQPQFKQTSSQRRRSYIPLPDDSCGPLPRSRTLSNLPIPVKSKTPVSALKSKSTMMLPPSRIPTPPKFDGRVRLASNTKAAVKSTRAKVMQRSDTEPLLSAQSFAPTSGNASRVTAFKENLTLSPIKPLPRIHVFEDIAAAPPHLLQPKRMPAQATPVTALKASQRSIGTSPQSSPITKPSFKRPATPKTMARHASQPVLTLASQNMGGKRHSYGAGIKQHKLLTPRQPPTPNPPVTPLEGLSNSEPVLIRGTDGSKQPCQSHELSPCSERSTPSPPTYDPEKASQCCVLYILRIFN